MATTQHKLVPMPGLIAFLDELKKSNVPSVCVTNAPRPNAEFLMGNLNIVSFFEHMVIGDECERAKVTIQ